MKVRYQADNDLRKAIVRGVVRREPQLNFRSAQAARLDGVPDPEVLALSADEGRILSPMISKPCRSISGSSLKTGAAREFC